MSIHIDVWSDFVWPFCFLVASSLEKLQQNYDVAMQWHAFMLRPPGTPPWPPQKLAMIERTRPALLQTAREQYGLEINQGPLQADSRPALVLSKYAEAQGKGNEFHAIAMKAYWQEACDIEDHEQLKKLVEQADLSSEHFEDILANSEYNDAVNSDMRQAQIYGLNAVPALIFADQYLVSGAQPYDLLTKVVERVKAETEQE